MRITSPNWSGSRPVAVAHANPIGPRTFAEQADGDDLRQRPPRRPPVARGVAGDHHPDALPRHGHGEDDDRAAPERVVARRGVHPPLEPNVLTSHSAVERSATSLVDSALGTARTQEAAWIHG